MRALGFCVSKEHARYMARKFTEAGLREHRADRRRLRARSATRRLGDLKAGRLRCVFSVEVLGEGVDVPDVDMRPAARARPRRPRVFTQQLGRGLRRARGKSSLTVIDLIGQQHREFRFEDRLRGDPRRAARARSSSRSRTSSRSCRPAARSTSTARAARSSSTTCRRQSDARAGRRWSTTCGREPDGIRPRASSSSKHDHRLEDVYKSGRSLDAAAARRRPVDARRDRRSRVRAPDAASAEPADARRRSRAGRLLPRRPRRMPDPPAAGSLDERHRRLAHDARVGPRVGRRRVLIARRLSSLALWLEEAVREELVELLELLDRALDDPRAPVARSRPRSRSSLHARYTRADVARGARHRRRRQAATVTRAGSRRRPTGEYDAFFVDLQKAERDYSPTTMYRDYAINRELFHWESQSTPDAAPADACAAGSSTRQRGTQRPALRPREEDAPSSEPSRSRSSAR